MPETVGTYVIYSSFRKKPSMFYVVDGWCASAGMQCIIQGQLGSCDGMEDGKYDRADQRTKYLPQNNTEWQRDISSDFDIKSHSSSLYLHHKIHPRHETTNNECSKRSQLHIYVDLTRNPRNM